MKHLTEDELIERYYGEDPPDRARHLETCRECSQGYAALKADLDEIALPDPPYRDEAYGQQVWRSLSPFLAAYPGRRAAQWRFTRGRFNLWLSVSAFAGCALLVAAAFYAGRAWEHRQQPQTPVAKAPAPAPQRVVILVLSDHLDRTERLLVELKHADADDSEIIPLRDEARNLLADNRRFRDDAEKSGDPDLSAALDRLESVLTELTTQPGGLNSAALTRLRHELDTDNLLFEVRVLRSRLPDEHANQNHALKGGAA